MGYILSTNRPPCLQGMDFTRAENIRTLMLEAMRYPPPVTVLPVWARENAQAQDWQHELICLDRALADPEVFDEPDEFKIDRPNKEKCCMAWAWTEEAATQADNEEPHQHACPGKELSIA